MRPNLKNLTAAIVAGISLLARAQEAADQSLPSVESVLKRVVANSEKENANDRAFSDRYSYIRGRFINKAAGRVWVDEEDSVLVKAELYLTDKVNVLGGLVGAVWKFNYGFHRERMPDGLWYTRTVDWHLEGREVIVRRTVDYH